MICILGAQGQVGLELAALAGREHFQHRAFGRTECDITDVVAVERAVAGSCCVVNCAAYTAVDRAEADASAAYQVNALGAKNVAFVCAKTGVPLLHISTDYVFDGASSRPAREEDPPRPLSVYGASKLAGEEEIRTANALHIILRTSWIFSARGQNFVKTILGLAHAQPEVRVVADQIGGPTAAGDLAHAIIRLTNACQVPGFANWGTYHFSGAPPVSWYDFARAIVAEQGARVLPVRTEEFPMPARRPLNSVLDCGRILRIFGIGQPDWRVALGGIRRAVMNSAGHKPA